MCAVILSATVRWQKCAGMVGCMTSFLGHCYQKHRDLRCNPMRPPPRLRIQGRDPPLTEPILPLAGPRVHRPPAHPMFLSCPS